MSEVILGIDLGTTNSLVAICEKGKPFVIKPKDGSSLVSSIIHVEKDGKLTVGSQAKVFKVTDTARTASSIKRFMGKGKEDLKDFHGTADISHSTDKNIIISLGEKDFTAVELSAEILKRLKKLAEDTLGHKVMKAVITVPAYFNDSQRTATKAAGLLAGLDVVRIVNEPTAAALAYGLDQKNQGTIAVYDLGGGTFDLSILKLNAGIFEVLSTNGDTALGGDDFDKVLFDIIVYKLKSNPSVKCPDPEVDLNFKALLLDLAEKAKIVLSTDIETKVNITYQMSGVGHKTSVIITRGEFESKSEALVERTLTVTKRALEDAKLNPSQIDNIVMVGGSTRLPIVQRKVREFFGKELDLSMNPDEVVALGAAIQADILSGNNRNTVLLDIIPLSLGIETYGGTVGKILHRNTKIPSIARETFTTHVEGQTNVLIHVLQGERELAADCRSLAKFNLKGLPALPAGLPKIQVTFLIDANGILNVQAKELATGIETAIDVKPTYGLNDEQVEKMLSDSFEFAESDMKSRQLIDTRVQAQGVLRSAEKILNESESLRETDIHSEHMAALGLTEDDIKNIPNEIEAMNTQIYKVRNMVSGTDYIAIKNELEKLEEIAKPLAAKVMNAALRRSLQNKNVSEVITKK